MVDLDNIKMDPKMREYLHSLSRLTDRLAQVVKDSGRIIEDADRIKRDALSMQDDALKLEAAITSVFNDLLKNSPIKLKEGVG